MGLDELRQAINLIRKSPRADFEGEKNIEIIEKAEHFLELKFPPSYKQFLQELGCGDIGGKEFYGIIDDNFSKSAIPNAIWLTADQRKNSALPRDFVLIGQSVEGYFALETSSVDSAGECPVIEWIAPGVDKKIVSSDFGTFFLNEIRKVL